MILPSVTRSGIVTLPGGERIQLHGFLPPGLCPTCRTYREAPYFLGEHWYRHRRLYVDFVGVCLACLPRMFPADLKGLTLMDPYKPDGYTPVGWQQRNREGKFGETYALISMQFRRTGDVLRPQPKFQRPRRGAAPALPQKRYPLLSAREQSRIFTRLEVAQAAAHQGGRCLACGLPFTPDNPATGDHHEAWNQGGSYMPWNCVALHMRCNITKSDRTYQEMRAARQVLVDQPTLFADDTERIRTDK